jgi:hydrogenase maturation factor
VNRVPSGPPIGETASGAALAAAALTLARRFADGATMWCVAPQWIAHGRHVAVEFVHPVIVGKRALPAVFVEQIDRLAPVARAGDVLLVISTDDQPALLDLMRRAEAWGLTRIWVGAGPPPPEPCAEHLVVLAEENPARAARSGDLMLCYHLLWELTHVVFEHPGLLTDRPECSDEVCITCSDEARVAEVRTLGAGGLAQVLVGGHLQTVDVSLVDPAEGDLVLVHAGVAIASLGEVGAAR